MTTFDFSPLFRSTVGFDRMQRLLESAQRADEVNGYPPYNIEKLEEHAYRITMAVAGFAEADIDIEVKDGVMAVSANSPSPQRNAASSTAASPVVPSAAASNWPTM